MWEIKNNMEFKEQIENALAELRKEKERKFDQSVDLIVNLQKFDVRKTPLNLFISVPHKIKDKRIGAFLEVARKDIDTITPDQFKKYKDKKLTKKFVQKYDFFIAQASVMPKVATTFGKVLGPAGKMPSPQMGIIVNADDKVINELKEKVNNTIKFKVKEPSIKLVVGKQSMKDADILENVNSVYNYLLKSLPREKENVKNVELKFTMTKPQKINVR
jgi:large subunit ribosomal protein L1